MEIKGADGHSYSVTGQAQGNFNTAGGIAGILSLLGINVGNILGRGGMGYGYDGCGCSENTPVNRYELNLVTALSSKDGEIALLKADKYTDQKIVEATTYLQGEIGKVADKLEAFKDSQYKVNMEQNALNATQTTMIGCIKAQIAQLQSLSQLVIPQSNVCDTSSCNQ